ncbi:hypothetical protein DL96DRAFT_1586032 [Flagelloscypha sp. PMI_526]|nr:hypothetical protein DL96DRAFT_1586032 [Flagelloscypha sp. PMI_526]
MCPQAAVLFDVIQIHTFAQPGFVNNALCLTMDPIIRIVGAVLLWSIELIMQLRIYALYDCSKRIAAFNGFLFILSIGFFLVLLVFNTNRRLAVIKDAIRLTEVGCPAIHSGIEWAQWIPPSIFEAILFIFAIGKTVTSSSARVKAGKKLSLLGLMTRDHFFYFFTITVILILNNLMASGAADFPWFSYGPFHAATGIMTAHMLIHLRKATSSTNWSLSTISGSRSGISDWFNQNPRSANAGSDESERGHKREMGSFSSLSEAGLLTQTDTVSGISLEMTFAERPEDEQWPDTLKEQY